MYNKIKLFALTLLIVSCNAAKPTTEAPLLTRTKRTSTTVAVSQKTGSSGTKSVTSGTTGGSTNEVVNLYILNYKDVAMNSMRKFGIPASIVLAQGILESGAGKSELTQIANNHFGIKCNSDWAGDIVRHDDDKSQECFRKYNNSAESYDDHARVLTSKSRYASLFGLPKDDYIGWANGLRAAGYATDPQYPQKLINYIEKYELRQFDLQVLGKKQVYATNSAPVATPSGRYHEVQKGDTLYSLSKKYNVPVDEIIKKNNIQDNKLSLGQFIYY